MIATRKEGFESHDFQFCDCERIGLSSFGFISLLVTAKAAFTCVGLFVFPFLFSPFFFFLSIFQTGQKC